MISRAPDRFAVHVPPLVGFMYLASLSAGSTAPNFSEPDCDDAVDLFRAKLHTRSTMVHNIGGLMNSSCRLLEGNHAVGWLVHL